ncbi:amino acid adenylation enzyme/thioester reductase family protein [Mycolicibacterium rhodesiae NBB3]|uniref:Amino acid adenylation enzyme/thioester reductase family protein n=1 Tax=Mycolicibacterium rhodesiae (strain NBB3) TaxID=710685 RepID=G8RKN3_MYCRN|nr:non-ribosomal peptide synthetase [Mycolicibacterium rhodesiae]AEV74824.1 amino acid adenylation enzyme/thioester reductase family protein [Mycolicibacterium rhodesiae NBB3]
MTATETKVAVEDVMALSPLQQGLFSLSKLNSGEGGGEDPYVIAMSVDVFDEFDPELLRECAAALLARHPNLRASFFHGDLTRPVQVVPTRVEIPWRTVTASAGEVNALDADERLRPFDLERGPAIRFLIIDVPGSHRRFVVVAHHILLDGWSLPLFMGELIALYRANGDVGVLPPPPRPYRDYIGWLAGRDQDVSRRLWSEHLGGMDGPTLLTPSLTAGEPAAGAPRRTELKLDRDTTVRLADAARSRGVTVNTLVQMSWAVLLSAFTDRSDVVFGVTVSGRPSELTGVETMIGLFINTVPLRVRLDPTLGIGTQCVALQREAAKLRDHSYLAHSELRALGGVGEMYDSLLVYENFPPGELVGGGEFTANGATFRPASLESLSHFPVTIAAHMVDDRLTVLVEVVDGALGAMTPESLGERLLTTVQRMITQWGSALRDVSVLLDAELAATFEPIAASSHTGVHTKFTETAYTRLASPALSWSDGTLTYRELDEAADGLAAALVARGVCTEDPVAVCLSRGPAYVIAMLGVLKAGGVIVPLDPAMPADRIADILSQCDPAVVVDDALMSTAPVQPPDDFEPAVAHPGQAAYVVFTSGTTGRPKGVVGTHRALLAYAEDHAQQILCPAATRLSHPLRVAHAWSFTFDAAWQPLVALLDGHSVHIVDGDVQRDAEALVETIARHGIDMIDTTPSMLAQLYAVGLLTTVPLGVLALGGEAIGIAAWDQIRDECARTGMSAYNCYGPTETTVEAVVADIAAHEQPTIGRPTAPTRAHVLDSWLRPVPDAVAGELYLSGHQLTRGYLGRPGETAARFVADPNAAGERMYRTGDVVRRLPGGALQFLGRSDAQVKIRGFRVEPAEIAAVLHSHPAVHHAHVAVRERIRGGPRLMAYVAADPAPDVSELRAMLSKRLPRYMVPQSIAIIDQMPLTSHGKIDETALAAIAVDDGPSAAPETETESGLVAVLAELLDTTDIDVTAEFLSLGLDSIVALSVVQGARRRGIPLRARLMLECATIRELAAAVDSESVTFGRRDDETTGPIPVLPNVHWLFEQGQPRRLAQTEAIRLPDGITRSHLDRMLQAVVDGHEVLRSRLDFATMTLVEHEPRDILTEVWVDGPLEDAVAAHSRDAVERLAPQQGSMLSAVWLRQPEAPGVLVLTAHVLALDPASWRIVLGELDAGWHAIESGRDPVPALEHTSYRRWSRALAERAAHLDTADFWVDQLRGDDPILGARRVRPTDRVGDVVVSMSLTDAEVSKRLLNATEPTQNLLAVAAARTIERWRVHRGQDPSTPLLALETHGRADGLVHDADTSDTVGLLTAIYPMRVPSHGAMDAMPGDGIDYGLLRYLRPDTAERLKAYAEPQILLNFLGRIHVAVGGAMRPDRALLANVSPLPEPDLAVRHAVTILAAVIGEGDSQVLGTQWRTLPDILSADDVATLQSMWQDSLREVAP